jgi:hypothetical protein
MSLSIAARTVGTSPFANASYKLFTYSTLLVASVIDPPSAVGRHPPYRQGHCREMLLLARVTALWWRETALAGH